MNATTASLETIANRIVWRESADVRRYCALNFTMLRIGDSKIPTHAWKYLQTNKNTQTEIDTWESANIGILAGEPSGRLLIVDIDDMEKAIDFEMTFPELAKTRKVGTKRGVHYYYTLEAGIDCKTRRTKGVDILWTGSYALAPPSDGYDLMVDGLPRQLDSLHYARLMAYFVPSESKSTQTTEKPRIRQIVDVTASTLIGMFRGVFASTGSRNVGLFNAGRFARDNGILRNDSMLLELIDTFEKTAKADHRHEMGIQRLREARKTLDSVYSQAPMPIAGAIKQLPDQLREKLLQAKLANVARVLDGLYLMGYAEGDEITAKEAEIALGGIISREGVRKALQASFELERGFLTFFSTYNNQLLLCQSEGQKGLGGSKGGKGGRPATRYRIPTIPELIEVFEIEFVRYTPMSLEDVASVKLYRHKLHHNLIQRKPAQYTRSWLGKRLGISGRSIWNYNHDLKIIVTPKMQFLEEINMLNFKNLSEKAGHFLRIMIGNTSKRVSATAENAKWALLRGHGVALYRQVGNFYSTSISAFRQAVEQVLPSNRKVKPKANFRDAWLELYGADFVWEAVPALKPKEPVKKPCTSLFWTGIEADTEMGITGIKDFRNRPDRRKKRKHKKLNLSVEQWEQISTIRGILFGREKSSLSARLAVELITHHGFESVVQSAVKVKQAMAFNQVRNPVGMLRSELR